MLKLIMNNLFSKPATRLYPIEKENTFERSRGRIECNPNTCILCTICAKKCPADAIEVDRVNGKWELNVNRCIICGECVAACPKKSITMTNERRTAGAENPFETLKVTPPKPAPKPATPKPTPPAAQATEAKAETASAVQKEELKTK